MVDNGLAFRAGYSGLGLALPMKCCRPLEAINVLVRWNLALLVQRYKEDLFITTLRANVAAVPKAGVELQIEEWGNFLS